MDFRLIKLKETTVVGVTRKFEGSAAERFEQVGVMWAIDCDFVPGKICNGFDGVWYGIWDRGTYRIARDAEDTDAQELESYTIPAGTYAAFTTQKGLTAGEVIPELRAQIFDSWLPDSGYVQKEDLEIEVYHLWTDKEERRKNRYYEIWIPVEKK